MFTELPLRTGDGSVPCDVRKSRSACEDGDTAPEERGTGAIGKEEPRNLTDMTCDVMQLTPLYLRARSHNPRQNVVSRHFGKH